MKCEAQIVALVPILCYPPTCTYISPSDLISFSRLCMFTLYSFLNVILNAISFREWLFTIQNIFIENPLLNPYCFILAVSLLNL